MLKTKSERHAITPASNILYKKSVLAMLKCMVSMAAHSGFENGGMPTKVLISQLLLILDY